ncbi:unnamed protein product [Paramecium pentaurelia]|uniref:Uncharacterized protein n=1 Tax=Paramecium pentaurelia TaxID=43138 RepID=A0A8S1WWJ4_9CILI|nr:unnamed protein product [Paramecium pentaurelia]
MTILNNQFGCQIQQRLFQNYVEIYRSIHLQQNTQNNRMQKIWSVFMSVSIYCFWMRMDSLGNYGLQLSKD